MEMNVEISGNFLGQFTTKALLDEIERRTKEEAVGDFEPVDYYSINDSTKLLAFAYLRDRAKEYLDYAKDNCEYDYDLGDKIVRYVLDIALGEGAADAIDDLVN